MTLIFIDTEKEFDRIISKADRDALGRASHYPYPNQAHTMCLTNTNMGLIIIVTMGELQDNIEGDVEALLTHEAVHVKQFLFETIEEEHPGIETEAYIIQYFSQYLITEYYYRENKRKAAQKKGRAK